MTGASHRRPIGSNEPAGEQHSSFAINAYRPASREVSLMLAIPYPKRSTTGFEKAE
jgi:hypothetical protein